MSINYNDLFQTAVLLIQYKGEKTITSKVIQYAFIILYLKNNLSKKALSNASKYIIYFTECMKPNECRTETKNRARCAVRTRRLNAVFVEFRRVRHS